MKAQAPSLLVVGGTKVGKTHYGGQLLRRLEAKKYPLRIVDPPSDLTPFHEVLESLAEGRSAPHTPTPFYRESVWRVRHDERGYESELVWPDYGGEQIEDIVKQRHITRPWIERIRQSSGWLFFVRPGVTSVPEDILARPRRRDYMMPQGDLERAATIGAPQRAAGVNNNEGATDNEGGDDNEGANSNASINLTLSTQAGLVELLQALLFVRQVGLRSRLSYPTLVVVVSCLDEIEGGRKDLRNTPSDLLKTHLPLLYQFIKSTWADGSVDILGLSALGRALDSVVSDEEFRENGPERQGWCVQTDGYHSNDLTLPIVTLMDKYFGGY